MPNKKQLFISILPLHTLALIQSALHILFTMLTLLCKLIIPVLLLCFCSSAVVQGKKDSVTRYPHRITSECLCFKLCLVQSSLWLPLTPLLYSSPEYHSNPVGASSCDLCHPDGVFHALCCSVLLISRSLLLPELEESQTV